MSNTDATNYARIALLNLQQAGAEISIDTLLYEMNALFDLYNETAIAEEAFFRL